MLCHGNHFHNFNKLRLKNKSYIHSFKLHSNLSFDIPLANGGITFLVCRFVCPLICDEFGRILCATHLRGFITENKIHTIRNPLLNKCGGVRLHQPVSRRVRMPPEPCSARAKRHSGAITRRGSVASGRAVELTSCVALSSSKLM